MTHAALVTKKNLLPLWPWPGWAHLWLSLARDKPVALVGHVSLKTSPHISKSLCSLDVAHVVRSNWSGQSSNNIINSCLDRVQDRYREGLQPSQQFAGKRPQAAADIKVADHTRVCLKIGISWNTLSFGILYGYLIGKIMIIYTTIIIYHIELQLPQCYCSFFNASQESFVTPNAYSECVDTADFSSTAT